MNQRKLNILILGATSAIALEAARIWACQGANLVLVARNKERLEHIKKDLMARGASSVRVAGIDPSVPQNIQFLESLIVGVLPLDVALVAHGMLGSQGEFEKHPELILEAVRVNYSSVILWCQSIANMLVDQKCGSLIVVGSVAGDRGRQSNYIYGSTKAGLAVFVEGLAHRVQSTAVSVILIKPGLVDTPMTAAFEKTGFFWSKSGEIGKVIVASVSRSSPVVYAPSVWRYIMFVIRNIPWLIFRRTRL